MIVIDDLRPQLKTYGLPFMHTPHMDALAADGVLFENAYAQQSICSPSRNSFLSGRYPSKTLTWNFIDSFRSAPGGNTSAWEALPEFFRNRGYYTAGSGKIYHPNHPPNFDQVRSWSQPWLKHPNCSCDAKVVGGHATCEGVSGAEHTCGDDKIVEDVLAQVSAWRAGKLGDGKQPFFIAAGLHKPHMPFWAPQSNYELYMDPDPPQPLLPPRDQPFVAFHSCLSQNPEHYSDWGHFVDIPNNMTRMRPMNSASAARLRRGYYAAVTYTDSNVGKILAAIDPIKDQVAVALIGDHGWNLGEGNEWCKMTEGENGVRVPLIFRAPWMQAKPGLRSSQLAESVDLYRTLADLSGLGTDSVQDTVDGISLAQIISRGEDGGDSREGSISGSNVSISSNLSDDHHPPLTTTTTNMQHRHGMKKNLRVAARSVFPRCYTGQSKTPSKMPLPYWDRTDCQDIPRENFDYMGYSIRTDEYRYTEWRAWNGAKLQAHWDIAPNGTELYNHTIDNRSSSLQGGFGPFASERVNLAGHPGLEELQAKLAKLLRSMFAPNTPQASNY